MCVCDISAQLTGNKTFVMDGSVRLKKTMQHQERLVLLTEMQKKFLTMKNFNDNILVRRLCHLHQLLLHVDN